MVSKDIIRLQKLVCAKIRFLKISVPYFLLLSRFYLKSSRSLGMHDYII